MSGRPILFSSLVVFAALVGDGSDSAQAAPKKTSSPAGGSLAQEVQSLGIGDVSAADVNACANSSSSNRGRLGDSKAFFLVTLKTFARSACRSNSDAMKGAMTRAPANRNLDGTRGASGSSALVSTYMTILHLGMRESSGNFAEGRDRSASNYGSTEEAGVCQTSYNVRGVLKDRQSALVSLERSYAGASPEACFGDLASRHSRRGSFRSTVPDASRSASNFTRALKTCPALAIEHCAMTVKNAKTHYGPLIRGEARPFTRCEPLLRKIESNMQTTQNATCDSLLAYGKGQSTPATKVAKKEEPKPKATKPKKQQEVAEETPPPPRVAAKPKKSKPERAPARAELSADEDVAVAKPRARPRPSTTTTACRSGGITDAHQELIDLIERILSSH